MSTVNLTVEMRKTDYPTEQERMVAEFILMYTVAYYAQGEDRDELKVYRGKGGAVKEAFLKIFPEFMKTTNENYGTQVDLIWKAEKDLCVAGFLERFYFVTKAGKLEAKKLNLIPAYKDGEILTNDDGDTIMTFEKVSKPMYLRPAPGVILKDLFVDANGEFHTEVKELPTIINMEELNKIVAEAYDKDVNNAGKKKTYSKKSFWNRK